MVALGVLLALLPRVSAFLLEMTPPRAETPEGLSADALRYSFPGPRAVGTTDVVIDDEAPMEIVVWYPTPGPGGGRAEIVYPFELNMFSPRSSIAIASSIGRARRDAPSDMSAGPYPLVILSPGFAIGGPSYGWLADHLASYGFFVVALEHEESLDPASLWRSAITRPEDVSMLLADIREQSEPGGALAGMIDMDRFAVIGHSLGGFTALAAGGARLDTDAFESRCRDLPDEHVGAWLCDALVPRISDMATFADLEEVPDGLWPSRSAPGIDAVVSMAGDAYLFDEAGLAQIDVPVLAVGGTADRDTPFAWGTQLTWDHVSSSRKVKVALEGAAHMTFTGPCDGKRRIAILVLNEFCSEESWDRRRAHEVISHFVTAFLLAEVKQDDGAASALDLSAGVPQSVDVEVSGYATSQP